MIHFLCSGRGGTLRCMPPFPNPWKKLLLPSYCPFYDLFVSHSYIHFFNACIANDSLSLDKGDTHLFLSWHKHRSPKVSLARLRRTHDPDEYEPSRKWTDDEKCNLLLDLRWNRVRDSPGIPGVCFSPTNFHCVKLVWVTALPSKRIASVVDVTVADWENTHTTSSSVSRPARLSASAVTRGVAVACAFMLVVINYRWRT